MQAMLVQVVPAAHRSQAQAIAEIAHQLSNFSASIAAGVVVNDSGWRGVALGTVFPVAVGALGVEAVMGNARIFVRSVGIKIGGEMTGD